MHNHRSNAGLPPLPDELPPAPQVGDAVAEATGDPNLIRDPSLIRDPAIIARLKSLRCGCYLVNYTPTAQGLTTFDGTIRMECHSNGRTASGDLYQRRVFFLPLTAALPAPAAPPIGGPVANPPILPQPQLVLGPPPNPANGIPILARNRYRYYLRVTQLIEFFTIGSSFTLGFDMYRFTAPNTWANEGAFTALMQWIPAPAGFPSSGDYLEGTVKNAANVVVGRLKMGWVSKYLRKATVEIDRVNGSEAPLDNGAGVTWKTVFDKVGYDILLDVSDSNVAEPSGAGWSDSEMHSAMLSRRDLSNLDTEWRYHVLAVKTIDVTPRGIMYDSGATDSNNVAREGIGISSHWVIPNASPWGTVKGLRFGTAKAPYFRTAVHEIGHALGLFHTTGDNGFMNTTDVIAASCPATFPSCIKWDFHPDNLKQLRHYPDAFVRPGMVQFGSASTATPPITPTDLDAPAMGLTLTVSALMGAVPIGAPVRINIILRNESEAPVVAPATLSMKTGMVSGAVIDPSGTVRTFSSLFLCVDETPLAQLAPGQTIEDSITLLRGGEGALFPMPGIYRIQVLVHWDARGLESTVLGETSVMVTAAMDTRHAEAALKVLSTPDTLLTLVLGGDSSAEGIGAVQAALDDPVLRPHYEYIEAKRLSERYASRPAKPEQAAVLINEATVMSPAEKKKADKLVKASAARRSK